MTNIRVFDPAMCCTTGICGPSVDPQLARFAGDLDWLKDQGVTVERFNLSQQPGAFADDSAVKSVLETKGEGGLPLIMVNNLVKSSGIYPTRAELATWTGVGAPLASIFTEAVAELVAIGAAIASNCEPCFKYHYDKARKLGVSHEDMLSAVTTAQNVKDSPAKAIRDLAQRYLSRDTAEAGAKASQEFAVEDKANACCAPAAKSEASEKKSGCC